MAVGEAETEWHPSPLTPPAPPIISPAHDPGPPRRFPAARPPASRGPRAAATPPPRSPPAAGVRVGVYTDAPEAFARVALAHLGAARRVEALECGDGARGRLVERLGGEAEVAADRDDHLRHARDVSPSR